ncbi:MAG: DUF1003 domain-containing protein [Thermomicrobiales bacterium]
MSTPDPSDIPLSDRHLNATTTERNALRKVLNQHGPHHVRNLNDIEAEHLTPGARIADDVARVMGSWTFIIIQTVALLGWIALNVLGWIHHWDPYPFILLNLALSFQAAYSAPIIMMSQNRQATKDRLAAEHDYKVNVHAEAEVATIRERLDDLAGNQWAALLALQQQQLELLARIESLTTEVHRLTVTQPDGNADAGSSRG